jgi:multidrug resistance efflux pump
VALGLTEGDYVRMVQVGTFVSTSTVHAVAFFTQNTVQFIEPGMPVEMALRMYPGRILTGVVESVTYAAGEAQMPVSGQLPAVNSLHVPQRFPVRIRLDEVPEGTPFEFAASGSVAVYTDAAKPFHIIRKIVMRMQSILNWLPF